MGLMEEKINSNEKIEKIDQSNLNLARDYLNHNNLQKAIQIYSELLNSTKSLNLNINYFIYLEYSEALIRNAENYFEKSLLNFQNNFKLDLDNQSEIEEDLNIAWETLEMIRNYFQAYLDKSKKINYGEKLKTRIEKDCKRDNKIEELENKVNKLKDEINRIEGEVDNINKEVEDNKNKELEDNIKENIKDIKELENEINKIEVDNKNIQLEENINKDNINKEVEVNIKDNINIQLEENNKIITLNFINNSNENIILSQCHHLLGDIQLLNNNFLDAISEYKKSLEFEFDSHLYIKIAQCHEFLKDYENALKFYDFALKSNKNDLIEDKILDAKERIDYLEQKSYNQPVEEKKKDLKEVKIVNINKRRKKKK